MSFPSIGIAAVVLLAAVQNTAPVPVHAPPSERVPMLAAVDRTFAAAAMQGNDAEIDAARLALSRSSTSEVTSFARTMLEDHGDIGREAASAIEPSYRDRSTPRLSNADALALRYLALLGPVDFDQNYATVQVADHLATATAFAAEARDGRDPKMRAFAAKWLPTIQAHVQLAVAMAKSIGGSSPIRK